MNILVIGNGFDLAHGLPTKYTDFLDFIKIMKQNIRRKNIEWDNINPQIRTLIEKKMSSNYSLQKVIWNALIQENFWVEYFLQCNMYQKENWIDFEIEMCQKIKSLNKYIYSSTLEDNIDVPLSTELSNKVNMAKIKTHKQLRNRLLSDLNRFIKAIEIYMTEYVEEIDISIISPDIKKIVVKTYEVNGNKGGVFCQVLSFNYTNTYEKVYLNKYQFDWNKYIDYIHGKADINNTLESNNMVLGIDEYLPDKRKNKDVEFIAFKKYYQRIYKQTGCKYKEWVDEIKADKSKKHNLYIFGHSLDITDKDILRDLILNDNVYTTIFYHSKDAMGQQIANLVKVIGQDELIKRTGGSTKTIAFKPQQELVSIKK